MSPNYNRFPGPGDLWYEDEDEDDTPPFQPDDELEERYLSDEEADYVYDPLSRKGFE